MRLTFGFLATTCLLFWTGLVVRGETECSCRMSTGDAPVWDEKHGWVDKGAATMMACASTDPTAFCHCPSIGWAGRLVDGKRPLTTAQCTHQESIAIWTVPVIESKPGEATYATRGVGSDGLSDTQRLWGTWKSGVTTIPCRQGIATTIVLEVGSSHMTMQRTDTACDMPVAPSSPAAENPIIEPVVEPDALPKIKPAIVKPRSVLTGTGPNSRACGPAWEADPRREPCFATAACDPANVDECECDPESCVCPSSWPDDRLPCSFTSHKEPAENPQKWCGPFATAADVVCTGWRNAPTCSASGGCVCDVTRRVVPFNGMDCGAIDEHCTATDWHRVCGDNATACTRYRTEQYDDKQGTVNVTHVACTRSMSSKRHTTESHPVMVREACGPYGVSVNLTDNGVPLPLTCRCSGARVPEPGRVQCPVSLKVTHYPCSAETYDQEDCNLPFNQCVVVADDTGHVQVIPSTCRRPGTVRLLNLNTACLPAEVVLHCGPGVSSCTWNGTANCTCLPGRTGFAAETHGRVERACVGPEDVRRACSPADTLARCGTYTGPGNPNNPANDNVESREFSSAACTFSPHSSASNTVVCPSARTLRACNTSELFMHCPTNSTSCMVECPVSGDTTRCNLFGECGRERSCTSTEARTECGPFGAGCLVRRTQTTGGIVTSFSSCVLNCTSSPFVTGPGCNITVTRACDESERNQACGTTIDSVVSCTVPVDQSTPPVCVCAAGYNSSGYGYRVEQRMINSVMNFSVIKTADPVRCGAVLGPCDEATRLAVAGRHATSCFAWCIPGLATDSGNETSSNHPTQVRACRLENATCATNSFPDNPDSFELIRPPLPCALRFHDMVNSVDPNIIRECGGAGRVRFGSGRISYNSTGDGIAFVRVDSCTCADGIFAGPRFLCENAYYDRKCNTAEEENSWRVNYTALSRPSGTGEYAPCRVMCYPPGTVTPFGGAPGETIFVEGTEMCFAFKPPPRVSDNATLSAEFMPDTRCTPENAIALCGKYGASCTATCRHTTTMVNVSIPGGSTFYLSPRVVQVCNSSLPVQCTCQTVYPSYMPDDRNRPCGEDHVVLSCGNYTDVFAFCGYHGDACTKRCRPISPLSSQLACYGPEQCTCINGANPPPGASCGDDTVSARVMDDTDSSQDPLCGPLALSEHIIQEERNGSIAYVRKCACRANSAKYLSTPCAAFERPCEDVERTRLCDQAIGSDNCTMVCSASRSPICTLKPGSCQPPPPIPIGAPVQAFVCQSQLVRSTACALVCDANANAECLGYKNSIDSRFSRCFTMTAGATLSVAARGAPLGYCLFPNSTECAASLATNVLQARECVSVPVTSQSRRACTEIEKSTYCGGGSPGLVESCTMSIWDNVPVWDSGSCVCRPFPRAVTRPPNVTDWPSGVIQSACMPLAGVVSAVTDGCEVLCGPHTSTCRRRTLLAAINAATMCRRLGVGNLTAPSRSIDSYLPNDLEAIASAVNGTRAPVESDFCVVGRASVTGHATAVSLMECGCETASIQSLGALYRHVPDSELFWIGGIMGSRFEWYRRLLQQTHGTASVIYWAQWALNSTIMPVPLHQQSTVRLNPRCYVPDTPGTRALYQEHHTCSTGSNGMCCGGLTVHAPKYKTQQEYEPRAGWPRTFAEATRLTRSFFIEAPIDKRVLLRPRQHTLPSNWFLTYNFSRWYDGPVNRPVQCRYIPVVVENTDRSVHYQQLSDFVMGCNSRFTMAQSIPGSPSLEDWPTPPLTKPVNGIQRPYVRRAGSPSLRFFPLVSTDLAGNPFTQPQYHYLVGSWRESDKTRLAAMYSGTSTVFHVNGGWQPQAYIDYFYSGMLTRQNGVNGVYPSVSQASSYAASWIEGVPRPVSRDVYVNVIDCPTSIHNSTIRERFGTTWFGNYSSIGCVPQQPGFVETTEEYYPRFACHAMYEPSRHAPAVTLPRTRDSQAVVESRRSLLERHHWTFNPAFRESYGMAFNNGTDGINGPIKPYPGGWRLHYAIATWSGDDPARQPVLAHCAYVGQPWRTGATSSFEHAAYLYETSFSSPIIDNECKPVGGRCPFGLEGPMCDERPLLAIEHIFLDGLCDTTTSSGRCCKGRTCSIPAGWTGRVGCVNGFYNLTTSTCSCDYGWSRHENGRCIVHECMFPPSRGGPPINLTTPMCSNRGVCSQGNNGLGCTCFGRFTGTWCEFDGLWACPPLNASSEFIAGQVASNLANALANNNGSVTWNTLTGRSTVFETVLPCGGRGEPVSANGTCVCRCYAGSYGTWTGPSCNQLVFTHTADRDACLANNGTLVVHLVAGVDGIGASQIGGHQYRLPVGAYCQCPLAAGSTRHSLRAGRNCEINLCPMGANGLICSGRSECKYDSDADKFTVARPTCRHFLTRTMACGTGADCLTRFDAISVSKSELPIPRVCGNSSRYTGDACQFDRYVGLGDGCVGPSDRPLPGSGVNFPPMCGSSDFDNVADAVIYGLSACKALVTPNLLPRFSCECPHPNKTDKWCRGDACRFMQTAVGLWSEPFGTRLFPTNLTCNGQTQVIDAFAEQCTCQCARKTSGQFGHDELWIGSYCQHNVTQACGVDVGDGVYHLCNDPSGVARCECGTPSFIDSCPSPQCVSCPSGKTGARCENSACSQNCGEHGQCETGIISSSCRCFPPWTGPSGNNPCTTHTCGANAKPVRVPGGGPTEYECKCNSEDLTVASGCLRTECPHVGGWMCGRPYLMSSADPFSEDCKGSPTTCRTRGRSCFSVNGTGTCQCGDGYVPGPLACEPICNVNNTLSIDMTLALPCQCAPGWSSSSGCHSPSCALSLAAGSIESSVVRPLVENNEVVCRCPFPLQFNCIGHLCQNGGTIAKDLMGLPVCQCATGFRGPLCEVRTSGFTGVENPSPTPLDTQIPCEATGTCNNQTQNNTTNPGTPEPVPQNFTFCYGGGELVDGQCHCLIARIGPQCEYLTCGAPGAILDCPSTASSCQCICDFTEFRSDPRDDGNCTLPLCGRGAEAHANGSCVCKQGHETANATSDWACVPVCSNANSVYDTTLEACVCIPPFIGPLCSLSAFNLTTNPPDNVTVTTPPPREPAPPQCNDPSCAGNQSSADGGGYDTPTQVDSTPRLPPVPPQTPDVIVIEGGGAPVLSTVAWIGISVGGVAAVSVVAAWIIQSRPKPGYGPVGSGSQPATVSTK